MTHVVARIFSGSGDRPPEELDQIVQQEVLPHILSIPGLGRISTLRFNDGRVGTFAVYENREAADKAIAIANKEIKNTPVLASYKLVETLRGDIVTAITGKIEQNRRNLYGVARIYETIARAEDIARALQEEAAEILNEATLGLVRYSLVRLEDGRVGAFTAFEDQQSAQQITERARELRSKAGSKLRHFLPTDPELYEGIILGTYTP